MTKLALADAENAAAAAAAAQLSHLFISHFNAQVKHEAAHLREWSTGSARLVDMVQQGLTPVQMRHSLGTAEQMRRSFDRIQIKHHLLQHPLDYAPFARFVDKEKANGSLVGDPAWESEPGSKKNTLQAQIGKMLSKLQEAVFKGLESADMAACITPLIHLLESVDQETLRSCIFNMPNAPLIPSGPALHSSPAPSTDLAIAHHVRGTGLLDALAEALKQSGTRAFQDARFQEAMRDSELAAVGSVRSTALCNAAAAALACNRFDDALEFCRGALLSSAASRDLVCDRQAAMDLAVGREVVPSSVMDPTIRWKLLIRQGRALSALALDAKAKSEEDKAKAHATEAKQSLTAAISANPSAASVARQELAKLLQEFPTQ
ncbi:Tetratricopeptide-like helical [Ceraceosorus bombacis]|uniref:Tetratricopeptide-like helical n=1 Tax=Ceraceosorus bombacis TaxID=401625 RepID=A0A0P1BAA3_9BASI|nr:Tetratricopeptide-like helical [Ceraceosorus bombacis]